MQELLKKFETIAKNILDTSTYDFISGGAMGEYTLRENEEVYSKVQLLPRMLRGAHNPDTSVKFFGFCLKTPILVAPMAFHKLSHPNAEVETAMGVEQAHTTMILSSFSTSPIEKVVREMSIPPWFQVYFLKDRHLTKALIERSEAKGCQALVITVDAPVYGPRRREKQNPIHIQLELPDLRAVCDMLSFPFDFSKVTNFSSLLDPTISWSDIEWLRSITKLPILLKGILAPDDALCAVSCGVNGIIISNHGGRQLDTTPASICVLPRIKDTVSDSLEIFIDGGIRKGTDVFKSLALGAKGVLIGRPILWGLAALGKEGVYKVLNSINQELKLVMTLSGCNTIGDITEEFIFRDN